jgi:hypothetical protein
LKLTKSQVLKGINYRADVYLPAYDATVEIRPLSDMEFSECRAVVDIFSMAKEFGIDPAKAENLTPEQIEELERSIDPDKLLGLDAKLNMLYVEVARRGLVDPELKEMVENPRKGELGKPDMVMAFELLRGNSLQIIGTGILQITTSTPKAIENFTTPQTEPSLQSST